MTSSTDRQWARFGQVDPYYGVLAQGRFRRGQLDDAAIEAFFLSGQQHVDAVFGLMRRCVNPAFAPQSALDFGCGVGRLVVPLAGRCRQVVGVDVSAGMLAEAQSHCRSRGLDNVRLVQSAGDLPADLGGPFDFVHTYIVLQHVAPRQAMALIRALIGQIRTGGFGAIHLTFARRCSALRRAAAWAKKRLPLLKNFVNLARGLAWSYPVMQMNRHDLNEVFMALYEGSCGNISVHFSDHGGHVGVMLLFEKNDFGGGHFREP
jgi:2-polyprenyl-3-methyl-5-hydroxy-6-metoxy-1,4-benzoquinol methylase